MIALYLRSKDWVEKFSSADMFKIFEVRGSQGQFERGLEHSGLVEGGWDWMSFKVPSSPVQCGIQLPASPAVLELTH